MTPLRHNAISIRSQAQQISRCLLFNANLNQSVKMHYMGRYVGAVFGSATKIFTNLQSHTGLPRRSTEAHQRHDTYGHVHRPLGTI